MKKSGWGLRVELLFILIFLVGLAFSTIMLNKLGFIEPRGYDSGKYNYIESELTSATRKYINSNYDISSISGSVIIKYKTLKNNGYTSGLYYNNSECDGYVVVSKSAGTLLYTPYIRCGLYTSDGYNPSNN